MTIVTVWFLTITWATNDHTGYGSLPTHQDCINLAAAIAPGKAFSCKSGPVVVGPGNVLTTD